MPVIHIISLPCLPYNSYNFTLDAAQFHSYNVPYIHVFLPVLFIPSFLLLLLPPLFSSFGAVFSVSVLAVWTISIHSEL